jgi:DNA-binding FadR family transcriptional regulator
MTLNTTAGKSRSSVAASDTKLAVRIAQRLEQEVMRQGWKVGSTIGSEGELADRLGVSRAVMREAISIAEHDGLIVSRRGRQGGLWIATPALEAVKTSLRNYLYYASVNIDDVMSTRLVLENLLIELATPHITEDIYTLTQAAGDTSGAGFAETFQQQMVLIRRLLELCENPALSVFLLALIDLVLGLLFRRGLPADALRQFSEQSARLRRDYVRHMFGRDLIRARQSLHQLVTVGEKTLNASSEANQLTESYPLRVALDLVMSPEELPLPVKGAEQLTHRIHAEIQRLGWPVDTSLGTEQELQKRFNVGRGVLREAIRPLERLGIVEMRPHAGLVVGRPDPTATIRSATLFLDHVGITPASARMVQVELELAGIGQLAVAPAPVRGALVRLLEASLQLATGDDPAALQQAVRRFYFCLVDHLPNRVISLFLRILTEPSHRNLDFEAAASRSPRFWQEVYSAQQRLAAAIANGDETQARRAMLDLQAAQLSITVGQP